MMSDMENFGGSLKEVTRLLGIGGIAGALLGIISNQVEAYQSLINVGQTFGGNIMNMSLQAANAGISLKLMTEVITKHGTLVANVGVKAVMDNQKEVRKLTKQYGQFGLTLTQMNEFNAIYMEQQQLQGILESNENNKRVFNQ